jgi:preprotein translocase subunit SecF
MKGTRKMKKELKSYISLRVILIVAACIILMAATRPAADFSQDLNFRLSNIERRLDQLQQRIDFIERAQQNQAINSAGRSNISSETILEIQRQQLSLAGQMVAMEKRILDLQKTVDQLRERNPEKKEKPKEDVKPKTPQTKPDENRNNLN